MHIGNPTPPDKTRGALLANKNVNNTRQITLSYRVIISFSILVILSVFLSFAEISPAAFLSEVSNGFLVHRVTPLEIVSA